MTAEGRGAGCVARAACNVFVKANSLLRRAAAVDQHARLWCEILAMLRSRLVDRDARIAEQHARARADLAGFAQFDLVAHLPRARCDERLRGPAAVRETRDLEQVVQ